MFSPSAVPSRAESTREGGRPLRGSTPPVRCRTFDRANCTERRLRCCGVVTRAALIGVLKAVDCRAMGSACLGLLAELHQPKRRFVAQSYSPDLALSDALCQRFVLILKRNVLSCGQDATWERVDMREACLERARGMVVCVSEHRNEPVRPVQVVDVHVVRQQPLQTAFQCLSDVPSVQTGRTIADPRHLAGGPGGFCRDDNPISGKQSVREKEGSMRGWCLLPSVPSHPLSQNLFRASVRF